MVGYPNRKLSEMIEKSSNICFQ
jgi:hypothetical protein